MARMYVACVVNWAVFGTIHSTLVSSDLCLNGQEAAMIITFFLREGWLIT